MCNGNDRRAIPAGATALRVPHHLADGRPLRCPVRGGGAGEGEGRMDQRHGGVVVAPAPLALAYVFLQRWSVAGPTARSVEG